MLLPLTIRPLCFSSSSWEIEIKNSNTPSLEEEEGILKKLKSNHAEEDHEEARVSLYTLPVLLALRSLIACPYNVFFVCYVRREKTRY